MKKNIKGYLHFYLGCDVSHEDGTTSKLFSVGLDDVGLIHNDYNQYGTMPVDQVKPILRPLSGMTEEEEREYHIRKRRNGYMYEIHADNTIWLLSKEFDLFDLHEAGLCLYRNEKGELY